MQIESGKLLTGSQTPTTNSASPDMDREAFMKLLVTQLQNQDPLDPMDAREMVTQLSQLTSVEQLESIERRLGALEVGTVGLANMETVSLVGKEVVADSSRLSLTDSINQPGSSLALEGNAQNVSVSIYNEVGNVVRTLELGAMVEGQHPVQWDGNDSRGQRLAIGSYRMEVSATDGVGNPVESKTEVSGRVSSVSYDRGYPELNVEGALILLGAIKTIKE